MNTLSLSETLCHYNPTITSESREDEMYRTTKRSKQFKKYVTRLIIIMHHTFLKQEICASPSAIDEVSETSTNS